jgi:hypothetical protein
VRTELQFIVERSPDLPPGSSHTVNITIQPLRDGLYHDVRDGFSNVAFYRLAMSGHLMVPVTWIPTVPGPRTPGLSV